MKTRLLKKLRRKAKKNVILYKKMDWSYLYHIGSSDNKVHWVITSYRSLEEAKIKLIEERRSYIIKVIKKMRIQRENKQLRKL